MWWPPLGTGPASPSPRPDAQGAEVSETAAATHGDLELVEVEWGTSEGAALVERLMSDLDQRYAPSTIGDEPSPPGRPRAAPPAAEPDDPRWAIDPTTVVRPQGAFVVARLGGVPVGCGALRPLPGGSNGVAEVKRMFTAPEARGRGVARAVLERLVVIAPGSGSPRGGARDGHPPARGAGAVPRRRVVPVGALRRVPRPLPLTLLRPRPAPLSSSGRPVDVEPGPRPTVSDLVRCVRHASSPPDPPTARGAARRGCRSQGRRAGCGDPEIPSPATGRPPGDAPKASADAPGRSGCAGIASVIAEEGRVHDAG